jgi:hypothetical protein
MWRILASSLYPETGGDFAAVGILQRRELFFYVLHYRQPEPETNIQGRLVPITKDTAWRIIRDKRLEVYIPPPELADIACWPEAAAALAAKDRRALRRDTQDTPCPEVHA